MQELKWSFSKEIWLAMERIWDWIWDWKFEANLVGDMPTSLKHKKIDEHSTK